MTDEELEEKMKTDPAPPMSSEDQKEVALQQMRANLYAAVFENCPGNDSSKTKAAEDAIVAFDGVEKP